jgi:hypothetical protein
MVTDLNPEFAIAPVLGSARGLVKMQPGWDEPMSLEEVEEVFCQCGEASGPHH